MNQLELNKKVADAYGVDAERYEYSEMKFYGGIAENNQKVKHYPINEDTLTLFKLYIEQELLILFRDNEVLVTNNEFASIKLFKDYPTKELATCAAMFSTLCKLKEIEDD